MNNFEKITASPEMLGAFLASLPIETGPWDEQFQRAFCDSCIDSDGTRNCDTPGCPHATESNNPTWWLMQAAEGEQVASGDSEREALIREYERRLERLRSGASPEGVIIPVWRNGRLTLEPGTVVQGREEPVENGTCMEFNVWLNGRGPDGSKQRNIKRVVLPDVSVDGNGRVDPMAMKLEFGGCEDAAEIIKLLGQKCKLEIRAAVQNWNRDGQIEYHGHSYILEAVPMTLKSDTVKRRGGTGLTIGFLVYRYTATVGDTELWDFEWMERERGRRQ